ncbi:MAG: tetratricopeptide repeat protein [Endomicrobiia bacterium]
MTFLLLIFWISILTGQEIDTSNQKENFTKQGLYYYKSKNYKQAMDNFMQAILIDPQNKFARKYLKKSSEKYLCLLRNEVLKERKKILKKAKKCLKEENKKIDTDRIKALYSIAKNEYKNGNYLRAFSKFKEISALKRNYKDTEYYISTIAKEMNEISKLDTYGDIEKLFYAKAFVAYFNEEYVNAINEWEKLININPKNEEVKEYFENTKLFLHNLIETERIKRLKSYSEELNKRAIENFKLKNYQLAIDLWKKVIDIAKNEKTDEFKKLLEETKKNIELAISEMRNVINKENPTKEIFIDEKLAEKHYTQGLISYSAGHLSDAIKEWEISLKYNPNYEKAKKAKERAEEELKIQK